MPSIQQLDKRALLVAFLIALGAIAIQPKLLEFSSKWAYGSWPARPQTSSPQSPSPQGHKRQQSTAAAQDQWGKEAVASAFKRYGSMAATESTKMRMAFGRLDADSAPLGQAIGYPGKLDKMDEAEAVNAAVCKAIGDMAVKENRMDAAGVMNNKQGSLFRVREAMWHYVRDWTEEGRAERTVIFKPILELLQELDVPGARGDKTVLVPGSGLGRMAWEISELGYTSTACEYSQYMNMALRYILNPLITTRPLAHLIQPWAHRFSHQYTADAAFRRIAFPDALPRLSKQFHLIEGDFNKVSPPANADDSVGYDYVVTVFFIDTSHNVAGTLKHIHSLLKPGGRWINLGPLLWASGGSVALELSLEEVKQAAEMTGFLLDTGVAADGTAEPLKAPRAVPCEYTGDSVGMFKRLYQAEFWTATKAADS